MNMKADTTQIQLAQKLLKNVRHVAYATVNQDGTPHNSPLMLIYNEDLTKLYIGSYSDSLHSKNIVRSGQAFVVLYDSFTKGQGGLYITGVIGHECTGAELSEALRVHNMFRQRQSFPNRLHTMTRSTTILLVLCPLLHLGAAQRRLSLSISMETMMPAS